MEDFEREKELNRVLIQESIEILNNAMKPIIEAVSNLQLMIKKSLENIDFSILQEFRGAFDGFRETIIKFGDSSQKFKTFIIEVGYPPHYEILPYEMIEIVELYETDKEKASAFLNKLMLEKFDSERLGQMFELWNQSNWIQNRIRIIKDIISAHELGLYNVSVPAAIAQIEGIIAQGFSHDGSMNGRVMKEYLTRLLSEESRFSFDDAIKAFYFEKVLVSFEHGKPIRSYLSRNAILHGADVQYGTAENSLKSILLLDYIFAKISENKIKNH